MYILDIVVAILHVHIFFLYLLMYPLLYLSLSLYLSRSNDDAQSSKMNVREFRLLASQLVLCASLRANQISVWPFLMQLVCAIAHPHTSVASGCHCISTERCVSPPPGAAPRSRSNNFTNQLVFSLLRGFCRRKWAGLRDLFSSEPVLLVIVRGNTRRFRQNGLGDRKQERKLDALEMGNCCQNQLSPCRRMVVFVSLRMCDLWLVFSSLTS